MESPPFWMWIVGFLLVLGPLVTVHEFGHYLVGRWFGVKADVFSIGFGKELFGRTDRKGTRWRLSAIPLGGYVQFAGDMSPASTPNEAWLKLPEAERNRTFQSKTLWQRTLIVAAGPVTNLLVAIAILAAFNFGYGKVVSEAEVVGFYQQSDARDAGLEIGDKIVAIDGNEIESFFDVARFVTPYPGNTVKLEIDRGGLRQEIPVKLSSITESDSFGNEATIADLGVDFVRPIVGSFASGSPAEAAGMEIGDRITAIDATQVSSFREIPELIGPRVGETVSVSVDRDGTSMVFPVTLASAETLLPDGGKAKVGVLGIFASPGEIVPVGPIEAVGLGAQRSVEIMAMMVTGIKQIVTGQRSVKELGGPVKIAKYSGEQLSLGWSPFVSFVAMISINLAFINLLPIPALDGGHLAFYAAEAVRRKPVGPRSQEWAFRTGVAFVLALMLFVTINDIASLPIFGN